MAGFPSLRLLARAARYRWKLNAPEIARMLASIPRGGTVIDVGAHKGGYTFWMGRAVGKRGAVLSVEPQERVAAALQRSVRTWGMTQVTVVNAAASDHAGRGVIHIPRDSTHGASMNNLGEGRVVDEVPVELVSIDSLVESRGLKRLDFVKIDAEGHELSVLAGGGATFAALGPSLLVESEARAHGGGDEHLRQLVALLGPIGYKGWFCDGRRWLPLEQMDVSVHQNYGHGRFCNNIFFERAR